MNFCERGIEIKVEPEVTHNIAIALGDLVKERINRFPGCRGFMGSIEKVSNLDVVGGALAWGGGHNEPARRFRFDDRAHLSHLASVGDAAPAEFRYKDSAFPSHFIVLVCLARRSPRGAI